MVSIPMTVTNVRGSHGVKGDSKPVVVTASVRTRISITLDMLMAHLPAASHVSLGRC